MIENWPYTNMYNLNLDWLLNNVKTIVDNIDTMPEDIKTEVLNELETKGIYSEQNPPPYPVNAQYIELPEIDETKTANWNFYRKINGTNYGIQFSAIDGTAYAYLMVGSNRYPIPCGDIWIALDDNDTPEEDWTQDELNSAYNSGTRFLFGRINSEDENYTKLYVLTQDESGNVTVANFENTATVNGQSGDVTLPTLGKTKYDSDSKMVPQPTEEELSTNNRFLRADGTWQIPAGTGSGTINSVNGQAGPDVVLPALGSTATYDADAKMIKPPESGENSAGYFLNALGKWNKPIIIKSFSRTFDSTDTSSTGLPAFPAGGYFILNFDPAATSESIGTGSGSYIGVDIDNISGYTPQMVIMPFYEIIGSNTGYTNTFKRVVHWNRCYIDKTNYKIGFTGGGYATSAVTFEGSLKFTVTVVYLPTEEE